MTYWSNLPGPLRRALRGDLIACTCPNSSIPRPPPISLPLPFAGRTAGVILVGSFLLNSINRSCIAASVSSPGGTDGRLTLDPWAVGGGELPIESNAEAILIGRRFLLCEDELDLCVPASLLAVVDCERRADDLESGLGTPCPFPWPNVQTLYREGTSEEGWMEMALLVFVGRSMGEQEAVMLGVLI